MALFSFAVHEMTGSFSISSVIACKKALSRFFIFFLNLRLRSGSSIDRSKVITLLLFLSSSKDALTLVCSTVSLISFISLGNNDICVIFLIYGTISSSHRLNMSSSSLSLKPHDIANTPCSCSLKNFVLSARESLFLLFFIGR